MFLLFSRILIISILTSNCLRIILHVTILNFMFRIHRFVIWACTPNLQVLDAKARNATTRVFYRFSRTAFSSSRQAISCLLPRRFLARDCRANMPKKRRKRGCGWRGAARKRCVRSLTSCRLPTAVRSGAIVRSDSRQFTFAVGSLERMSYVVRSTPMPRRCPCHGHGPRFQATWHRGRGLGGGNPPAHL